jgi:hypothetical protein
MAAPAQGRWDLDGRVVSPAASRVYSELGDAWWQWALTDRAAPAFALDDSYDCRAGQRGVVFRLTGAPAPNGDLVARRCTVPVGAPVLFPVINGAFVVGLDGDAQAVRDTAAFFMDAVTTVQASIDGRPVADLQRHRFASRALFDVIVGPSNAFGYQVDRPFVSQAFADGYWVLVWPLSRGQHVVRFYGKLVADLGEPQPFVFESGAAYRLTVR